jgi:hypothetical protein
MDFEKRKAAAVVAAAFGGKCPSCGAKDFASTVFKGVTQCCGCGCFAVKGKAVPVPFAVDFFPVPFADSSDVDGLLSSFVELAA